MAKRNISYTEAGIQPPAQPKLIPRRGVMGKTIRPIYALVVGIPEQREIIDRHCFGTCGKIILGALTDRVIGEMAVCRTARGECPQFLCEMTEPIGDVNGEPIFLRRLQKKTKPSKVGNRIDNGWNRRRNNPRLRLPL